ncbi:MAG: YqaA family protein [Candidatus Thioglobus sp.]|jgi:membrane protein YqaA with SNARE-associated domain|nr:DedA family protein [Candidatus Thioglobus sp.]
MDFFSQIYLRVLNWAESRYAIYYLSVVSFLESSVLPYPPPDVLLAPMALKRPDKAYYFAFICTIFSVLGGLAGYFLGVVLLDFLIELNLVKLETIKYVERWFDEYGFWVVGVAAFSPIPYKLATITAGTMSMSILPFIIISLIARGARYYLVAALVRAYGKQCDKWLQKYIDRLGYALIAVVVIGAWYAS